ncbi:MAG: proton glutamate symport protein [Bacteroidia bacterium]|jgi:proton glutamate symport protein
MSFHWKVLIWMAAGVLVGFGLQFGLDGPAYSGAKWAEDPGGIRLVAASGPAAKSSKGGLDTGSVATSVTLHRGSEEEQTLPLSSPEDFDTAMASCANGDVIWLDIGQEKPVAVNLKLDPDSSRAAALAPFKFVADIFLALLKMLIVPLILTSIITGVAGVGAMKDLRRLGGKTFGYYIGTSLLAVLVGQILVTIIQPGTGAALGLSAISGEDLAPDASFIDVLKRMVPTNIFESLSSNGSMLSVIFFALIFGAFITRAAEPHKTRITEFFESAYAVMIAMAEGILKLLPYGVFALLVGVVAGTGFGVFKPLLLYMFTVTIALVIHACIVLPLILKFVGGVSPLRWFKAMSPALMTAFSTSSSSMTLPVTLETVEKRGGASGKITSFTLPLGATINMDGTALYECIGVVFLAQYYQSMGQFDLTYADQGLVVMMALLASIGAAGIPSAGLVMMLTILTTLGLPVEGAALILAVDRPLDMLRTTVNVWSDSCGAAVIAASEGELMPPEPS